MKKIIIRNLSNHKSANNCEPDFCYKLFGLHGLVL
jgi:hypothetical protein